MAAISDHVSVEEKALNGMDGIFISRDEVRLPAVKLVACSGNPLMYLSFFFMDFSVDNLGELLAIVLGSECRSFWTLNSRGLQFCNEIFCTVPSSNTTV